MKYGGAYSVTYALIFKSAINGNIDSQQAPVEVVFELLDFSPKQGSIYGGTKITLRGGPFTTDLDETVVKVGYKLTDGIDHYCYLISATELEVTCRSPLDLNREAKEYEVVLFSATFEEGNCEMANGCMLSFLSTD